MFQTIPVGFLLVGGTPYTTPKFELYMYLFTDYSTGFGGKYGVQKDRVDQVHAFSSFSVVLIYFSVVRFCIIYESALKSFDW